MKIGFLVVGPTEREVIPMLVHRILAGQKRNLRLVPPRVVPQGDLLNARKIKAYVEKDLLPDHPDLSKVIVCRDSECTDPRLIEKDFQAVEQELKHLGIKTPVAHCIVVHALESWLMTDTETLSSFLGTRKLRTPNPESICKPKDALRAIFRKARRSYNPTRDNPKIAELVDVSRMAKSNTSFARFYELLKE